MIEAPRFILIGRKALAHDAQRVLEAVRIAPPTAVFCVSDLDARLAVELSQPIVGTDTPLAIVADFPFDLATINEGGAVVTKELPQLPQE